VFSTNLIYIETPDIPNTIFHVHFRLLRPFYRICANPKSAQHFLIWLNFKMSSCLSRAQPPIRRTTPYWLLATAYSICSQVASMCGGCFLRPEHKDVTAVLTFFVDYTTFHVPGTYSVERQDDRCVINYEGFGRRWLWPNRDTIHACRKAMKNRSQDNLCPCRNSKLEHLEYKSRELILY
jgi:hypothetical protein